MNTATLYKEEFENTAIWSSILKDLELPGDTDEIIVKAVSYVTETQRKGTRTKSGRKSASKKGCPSPSSKIQIVIAGGAVQSVTKPKGTMLEIRDYDIEGPDLENNENCEQDEEGCWYQRMVWDEDEIER